MPGAFGPILTTGVALSAAVVVVVNPVTATNADVRIPAAQAQVSKANGQALDMLDEDFIEAVGPKPAGSTNPLAILRDLVSTLVADAADLGRSAVMHAFVIGASVAPAPQTPELTAASYPYFAPYFAPPAPQLVPVLPWQVLPEPVDPELRPVVEQALTSIITAAVHVTDPIVVAAAFVAGVALAAGQGPVLGSLRGLVGAQLQPALDKVVPAVSLLPHPAFGDVIRDTVERYLPGGGISVLPGRGENSGTGLLAGGASAVGGDAGETTNRPARPTSARAVSAPLTSARIQPPLPVALGADLPAVGTVSPKHALSGPGPRPLNSAGITGLDRMKLSGRVDDARGSIGRAIKAHVESARG